jgi:hypothetical protein
MGALRRCCGVLAFGLVLLVVLQDERVWADL